MCIGSGVRFAFYLLVIQYFVRIVPNMGVS